MVRFATTCDICVTKPGTRSEEYTAWPTCTSCDQHVCPACMMPGSLVDWDGEGPTTCVCLECGVE